MIAAAPEIQASAELRARLADLYAAYDDALGEGDYERWLEFFTDACVYKIIPRENYDAGLPLGLMQAESRGMLVDRVAALRKTTLYAPRVVRRLVGSIVLRAAATDGNAAARRALRVFQTMLQRAVASVPLAARFYDRVVEDARRAALVAERICVTDATRWCRPR